MWKTESAWKRWQNTRSEDQGPGVCFCFFDFLLCQCALSCWEIDFCLSLVCEPLSAVLFTQVLLLLFSCCFYLVTCTTRFASFPGAYWTLKNLHQNNFLKLLKFSPDFLFPFSSLCPGSSLSFLAGNQLTEESSSSLLCFLCFFWFSLYFSSKSSLAFPHPQSEQLRLQSFQLKIERVFCFFMSFVQLTCVLCSSRLWL